MPLSERRLFRACDPLHAYICFPRVLTCCVPPVVLLSPPHSSELTCQNPAEKELEHADGLIGFPIVSDRMKLVTVGLCEWTVTLVKEQKVTEHAKLKGNTNVVW